MTRISVALLLCAFVAHLHYAKSQYATPPRQGLASATMYNAPGSYQNGATGACNCVQEATSFPTAAMTQYYFGAANGGGAGPACGTCWQLQVYSSYNAPGVCLGNSGPSMVVKIADLCPAQPQNAAWCTGSAAPNQAGMVMHFDLDSRYVSGFQSATGTGNWLVQYCQVDCAAWSGFSLGGQVSGTASPYWGSCPLDPTPGLPTSCSFAPPPCGGGSNPVGGGGGGGGSYSLVWNSGSNQWWFAVQFVPNPSSTPSVNCGSGQVPMTPCPGNWNQPNCYIWQNNGGPACQSTPTFYVGGATVSGTIP